METSQEELIDWVRGLIEKIVKHQYEPNAQWLGHIHELQGYFQSVIQQGHENHTITMDYQNGLKIEYTQELHNEFMEKAIASNWQSSKQFWCQNYHKASHQDLLLHIKIADQIIDLLEDLEFDHKTFKLNNPSGNDMKQIICSLYLIEKRRLMAADPKLLTINDADKFDDLGAFVHRSYAIRLDWDVCDHLELIEGIMPAVIANVMNREIDRYYDSQFKIDFAHTLPIYQRMRTSEREVCKKQLKILFYRATRDFETEDKRYYKDLFEDVSRIVRPTLRLTNH